MIAGELKKIIIMLSIPILFIYSKEHVMPAARRNGEMFVGFGKFGKPMAKSSNIITLSYLSTPKNVSL